MAFRDFLTKDAWWKLFSIALATVIWFLVHAISGDLSRNFNPLDRTITRVIDHVPVDIILAATEVKEVKITPPEVQVTVHGRAEIISALDEREIHATVDLRGIETAQKLRQRVTTSTPPGVTVTELIPREVDVESPPKSNP